MLSLALPGHVNNDAGACECVGERRAGAHACSATLAVAAIELKRVVSDREKAAINLILGKSGIIRDSLVRECPFASPLRKRVYTWHHRRRVE